MDVALVGEELNHNLSKSPFRVMVCSSWMNYLNSSETRYKY